jgi:signal peptide peptidase SppA
MPPKWPKGFAAPFLPDGVSYAIWAIRPDWMPTKADQQKAWTNAEVEAVAARRNRGGSAVRSVPLVGPVLHRFGSSPWVVDTDRVRRELADAMSDRKVRAVVLDVDSPGGLIDDVPELSADIYKMRGDKPIIAVANDMAGSAAYWIASAADRIVVSPSAEVGSIGVFAVHVDQSKMLEDIGLKPTIVSAGKYKAERSPFAPLGKDAQAYLQSRVDDYYGQFVEDVARNRGVPAEVVEDRFGQGRMVGAAQAVASRMADAVGTYNETVSALTGPSTSGRISALRRKQIHNRRAYGDWADAHDTNPTD